MINKKLILLCIIVEVFCRFDEQILFEKSSQGNGLYFDRKNQDEFYISNSITGYVLNIRTGKKIDFPAIIPLNSTIFEPFIADMDFYTGSNNRAYLIDAQTKNNCIKIYHIKDNEYFEYNNINIKKEYKRKFELYTHTSYNRFIVGIQNNENIFEVIGITSNGVEIFKSQKIDISNSTDFIVHTYCVPASTQIIAYIFYENKIVLHQWTGAEGGYFYYLSQEVKTNKLIKQNNIQLYDPHKPMICGQNEEGDIYCHTIMTQAYGGFYSKNLFNKVLQGCKSTFKLNNFNGEKYAVTCLNDKNEFVLQLFSYNFQLDYDLNGMVLWKDDNNDEFTYDVLKGKNNELVIIKANIRKNEYFIDMFNFIKNPTTNLYQLCPDGCQQCKFVNKLGIHYDNAYHDYSVLNCELCNFDKFFADNHGDICYSNQKRPEGYELITKNNKYSSCEYCCKTNKQNDICDFCLNEKKYIYFSEEPNKGRCVQKCEGNYRFIKYNKNICTNTCEGETGCDSFINYLNLKGEYNISNYNETKWCLTNC